MGTHEGVKQWWRENRWVLPRAALEGGGVGGVKRSCCSGRGSGLDRQGKVLHTPSPHNIPKMLQSRVDLRKREREKRE